jgi:transcriptional regulator with XRE-family HTH domain
MPRYRQLGPILKRYRESAGLTQEQLAHEAGLNRIYISMLERNIHSPTLFTLFDICKALKVRASRLIADMEK